MSDVQVTHYDNEIDRHAPLWQVMECLQKAILNLSDNEYVYADDILQTNIRHEEIGIIINHLKYADVNGSQWCAIEYSDMCKFTQ